MGNNETICSATLWLARTSLHTFKDLAVPANPSLLPNPRTFRVAPMLHDTYWHGV